MERYTPEEAYIEAQALKEKVKSGEATSYVDAEAKLKAEAESGGDFKSGFDQIMSKELTPENIDCYTEDAIQEIIKLVGSIKAKYATVVSPEGFDSRDFEDAALKLYGLTSINEVLDYISAKEEEIKKLDTLVTNAVNTGTVIVPPLKKQIEVAKGGGSFDEKQIMPRTKTILFILSNAFDIDVEDQKRLQLKTGVMDGNMMRKLSYMLIEVPELERTILACDEENNVTYIFNRTKLSENGLTADDLINLNKEDLNQLLLEQPEAGRRVRYSHKFATNLISLIEEIKPAEEKVTTEPKKAQLLYPKPPEGYISAMALAKKLGVSKDSVIKRAEDLSGKLGEVKKYNFHGGSPGDCYSLDQQALITQELHDDGLLEESAPEGYLSTRGLSLKLGVSGPTIEKIVEKIRDELGEIKHHRYYSKSVESFSPKQQGIITRELLEEGYFINKAPEGYRSAAGLAKKLGVSPQTVQGMVDKLSDILGTIEKHRYGPELADSFSEKQQAIITQELHDAEKLGEEPPEGYLSAQGFARKLDINVKTLKMTVEKLREYLGNIERHKYSGQAADSFSPKQQALITQELHDEGQFLEEPPEGYLPINAFAKKIGYSRPNKIFEAISILSDKLGEIKKFKKSSKIAQYYSPEQQEMIKEYLKKER